MTHYALPASYTIVDGHGNELGRGFREYDVWQAARDKSRARGESVWVHLDGSDEPGTEVAVAAG